MGSAEFVLWLLVAIDPGDLSVFSPASYAMWAECEIGRMQYEMQYAGSTWCEEEPPHADVETH